jgi:hypothetical protein
MGLPSDRVEVKIAGWLAARSRAVALGDLSLARSITADLLRIGYRDPRSETTVAAGPAETAVAGSRRGRPPKVHVLEGTEHAA